MRPGHLYSDGGAVSQWPLRLLVGAGVGIPVLLAALSGNLAIPHNDGFAYSLIARKFAETGSIHLVGWTEPFSVSQEVTLGPLGSSLVLQQLFVAVLAAMALIATYWVLRSGLSEGYALLGTAVVAAFPGFGLLATSFMEDIPAYCASILALVIGARAIERRSLGWLGLSVLVGLWGFFTREQALAAIAAVLAVALLRWPEPKLRRTALGIAVALAVIIVVCEVWRQSLPNARHPVVSLSFGSIAETGGQAYFTFGLLLLPATLLGSRPSRWPLPVRLVAMAVGLVGVGTLLRYHSLILGNYLESQGAYAGLLDGTRHVIPATLFHVLQIASLLGGVLLAGELLLGFSSVSLEVQLFGILMALGTAAEIVVGQPGYDRYLLPLMPVGVLAVLGRRQALGTVAATRRTAVVAALAGMFAISVLLTLNGLAFDSARWSQATRLVRAGLAPRTIDAGLEWVGFHSPSPAFDTKPSAGRTKLPWYASTVYPTAPECFVFAASPQSGLGRLIGTFGYRTFLLAGSSRMFLYDTNRCRGAA